MSYKLYQCPTSVLFEVDEFQLFSFLPSPNKHYIPKRLTQDMGKKNIVTETKISQIVPKFRLSYIPETGRRDEYK